MFALVHDVMPDVCTSLKTKCACMLHIFLKTLKTRRMKTDPLKTAEDGA